MKRAWVILFGGLAIALLAYGGSYLVGSAPCCRMKDSQTPELAWLQAEFHLSDNELARISKVHASYTAACAERCRRIDVKNDELQSLLAATNTVTPQIEEALREAAQLRAECQKAMLQHFYEVSHTMPRDQGRRYFSWVTARTFGPEHTNMTHDSDDAGHEQHSE